MAPWAPNAFTDTEVISTGYALIAVVTLFAIARICLHFAAPRRITVEDCIVFLAYMTTVTMCALYISLARAEARLARVTSGKVKPGQTLPDDILIVARRHFVATMMFWTILWLIKFAFLLLYRKLLKGLPNIYTWIWWAIVIVTLGAGTGNYAIYLTMCSDLKLQVNGFCPDMTINEQLVSLLYAYGADTVTNIMIMALPIRLTWNLQMGRTKKIGVVAIFATAVLCIIVATVRVAQIAHNTMHDDRTSIDGSWMAIWGMAECSCAVIVGFIPAFATLIRFVADKNSDHSHRGYHKQSHTPSQTGWSQPGQFEMTGMTSKASRGRNRGVGLDTFDASSQEELTPPRKDEIVVTTTLDQSYGTPRK